MHIRWLAAPTLLLGLVVAAVISLRDGDPPSPPDKKENRREPAGPPLFEDVTTVSGIDFTYRNGEDLLDADGKAVTDKKGNPRRHLAILESLGGGVALLDYDGDGLLDVFLVGGGYYAGPPDYHTIKGHPCKLYKNLGGLRFRDVTREAGLEKPERDEPWFYSHGAAVADYDRDGWPDLLVTGWGRVALFRNVAVDGKDPAKGRRFLDVTAKAGLARGIDWATSAAFGDLDGDGFPDLYVCQYVDWSWKKHPPCSYDGKTADVCPPKNFDGLPHKLYRNTGEGAFVDVGKEAGLRPGGDQSKGLGVLIVDVDADGKPDVYVANDTVDNFLYLNKSRPGQILLDEKGLVSGVARDDRGTPNGSMGLDAGDPERTGKPALWVTNYENELHALYRNESQPGRPFFHFCTAAVGIAAIGQQYVGWGTAFLDADLDGWEDLVVSNGHAIRFPRGQEANRRQSAVLLLNGQGKFRDAGGRLGKYFSTPRLGRGLAAGDLDNDGRVDLVLSHMNEPAAILRGIGGKDQHWLGVQLVGKDNACVVGAKVVVEIDGQRLTRFAKGGGSYASASDQRFVFALGKAKLGRLTVTWRDGSAQQLDRLDADRYHRLVQK